MAAMDTADVTAILRELYEDGPPESLLYEDSPTLAMLPTFTDYQGDTKKLEIYYEDQQGVSKDFTQGRANMSSSKQTAFDLNSTNYYGFAQITGEVIDRLKTDRGGSIRAIKSQMDGALRRMMRAHSMFIFGNGGGAIGQVASGQGTPTITLTNPTDTVNFAVGQTLQGDTTDGTSGAVHTGTIVVTAIDRDAGTLTAAGNWTASIASLGANDYLFNAGDFGGVGKGFGAWIPTTAPGATAFYGVDRSVDVLRLGGVRIPTALTSGAPLEEALQDAIDYVETLGHGKPDVVVVHPKQFTRLKKAMGARVVYGRKETDKKGMNDASIGFRSIVVDGPHGPVDVVADKYCPITRAYVLQTNMWEVGSMGKLVKVLDNDGNVVLRIGTSDGVEAQLVSRYYYGCRAPGTCGVAVLAA